MSTKVKITGVRLFFNDLHRAVEYEKGDGRPRYSAVFGVLKTDKPQVALLEAGFKAEAGAKWGAKADKTLASLRGNANKFCLTDGDAKNWEGAEGCFVLSAHRKEKDGKPVLLDQQKNEIETDNGILYSGCYVNATVEIWAQAGENAGMRCGLLGIQKFKDGDSFSGASKSNADDFDDVSAGADADDLA